MKLQKDREAVYSFNSIAYNSSFLFVDLFVNH